MHYCGIDTMFIGMCLYIMAYLKVMKIHFAKMDKAFKKYLLFSVASYADKLIVFFYYRKMSLRHILRPADERFLQAEMRAGVRLHYKILEYV